MFLFLLLFYGCQNPFAPKFDDSDTNTGLLISDQTTIEGVFQNFKYAYSFKDTTIYGKLIAPGFIFTYRDYDQGFDISWGREEEMKTTYGLFQNSQQLDLIWNNILVLVEDSLSASIVRGFNLTITFNPTDIIRVDGRVNISLQKDALLKQWQITKWIDESNL